MKFDEKFFIKKLKELLDIDSITGQYHELQDYLVKEAEGLGFKTKTLKKGGILIDLGGKGAGRVISAHADTIGLMVRHINSRRRVSWRQQRQNLSKNDCRYAWGRHLQ